MREIAFIADSFSPQPHPNLNLDLVQVGWQGLFIAERRTLQSNIESADCERIDSFFDWLQRETKGKERSKAPTR